MGDHRRRGPTRGRHRSLAGGKGPPAHRGQDPGGRFPHRSPVQGSPGTQQTGRPAGRAHGDPERSRVVEIQAHRRERGSSVGEARRLVERYVDRIVPTFNVLSYYRFGYAVARAVFHVIPVPLVAAGVTLLWLESRALSGAARTNRGLPRSFDNDERHDDPTRPGLGAHYGSLMEHDRQANRCYGRATPT